MPTMQAPAAPPSAPGGGRLVWRGVLVAVVAASCGLVFGNDNGGIGAVIAHPDFAQRFLAGRVTPKDAGSVYCHFDDALVQLFVSSFFIAAALAALVGSWTCLRYGRRPTMAAGGALCVAGCLLAATAQGWAQLVAGRLVLGAGVGAAAMASPLYLTETAPAAHRGSLNLLFQLCITVGIFVAQLAAYAVAATPSGWRLVLGLAGAPALLFTLGTLALPETPAWLAQAGRSGAARAALAKLRGGEAEAEAELAELLAAHSADADADADGKSSPAAAAAGGSTHGLAGALAPWRALFSRRHLFQLVVCLVIPAAQQLTGINAIMFFAPQVFMAAGQTSSGALLSTAVIGSVNLGATLVAIAAVDRLGRRPLLLQGGAQMILTLIPVGLLLRSLTLASPGGGSGGNTAMMANALVVLICLYVAAFAWSWGPLGWLLPAEVQPPQTRAAGVALNAVLNFGFTALIGQLFLSMLCFMQWGVFLFFAGCVALSSLFVLVAVPETKGVPLEALSRHIAEEHPLWSRVCGTEPAASRAAAAAAAGKGADAC